MNDILRIWFTINNGCLLACYGKLHIFELFFPPSVLKIQRAKNDAKITSYFIITYYYYSL